MLSQEGWKYANGIRKYRSKPNQDIVGSFYGQIGIIVKCHRLWSSIAQVQIKALPLLCDLNKFSLSQFPRL